MSESKALKRKEVAEILGVSPQQVDNYRKKGYLSSVQYMDKGMHRYDSVEVEALKNGR